MKRLSLSAIIYFLVAVLTSCDLPRTSQQICDCRLLEGEIAGEYSRLGQAPPHFNEVEFWDEYFASVPDPEYVRAFAKGTTHWYRNDVGEAIACRVLEGSDQIDAYIRLSADESQIEPLDVRIIGPEHVPPRMFWETC